MAYGALTRFGLAMEAAISTPTYPGTAATITKLLPVIAPELDTNLPVTMQTDRAGYGVPNSAIFDIATNSVRLSMPLTYENLEPFWCCALGFMAKRYDDTVFPETIVSGAYRHRYEVLANLRSQIWQLDQGWKLDDGLLLDDRHTRRLTLVMTLGELEAWEFTSAMVQEVTIAGAAGAPLMAQVQCLCGDFDATPSTNTLSALQALSVPTQPLVYWHQGETRLAPYSSSTALASGDVVKPSSFTLTIRTTLEAAFSRRSSTTMEEPLQSESITITGTLGFETLPDTTRVLAQRSQTLYMGSLVFTGGEIAATGEDYSLECYLPAMVLTGPQAVWNGPGKLAEGFAFTCRSPLIAAAGMPTTLNLSPLIMQLVSSVSTHPLE